MCSAAAFRIIVNINGVFLCIRKIRFIHQNVDVICKFRKIIFAQAKFVQCEKKSQGKESDRKAQIKI